MVEAKPVLISVKQIKPSPFQVRESFDDKGIEELAKSIHTYGLMYPILVRPVKGKLPYELVHGERRWRATQKIGQNKVLANVRKLNDLDAEVTSLVENIQREDLKPYELSKALKRLRDADLSYGEISKRTGKSESWIKDLVGFEESAGGSLKKAVERFYEEDRGRPATPDLKLVQRNPLPAVPMKVGIAITRATEDLPKIQAKVRQEQFAEALTKYDASRDDAEKAISVWKESGRKMTPEKAVRVAVKEKEEEQAKAADVVWVQFDKDIQDGLKVIMARENLPTIRETVVYLVRYALEEMDVIRSRR
jgi:ParB/RepB/Spo0J family partition protein